jgi:hypothetical protein
MIFLSDLIREFDAPRSRAYAWALDGTIRVEKHGSAVLVPEAEIPLLQLAVRLNRKGIATPVIREVLDAARAVPPEQWKEHLAEAVLIHWQPGWRYYARLADVQTPLFHHRRWAECLPVAEIL